MRTTVPEKLQKIVAEIDATDQANLTRLTVLKKWFERPQRLRAFALWIASRAASRQGKTAGEAGKLFKEARALLKGIDKLRPVLDRGAAANLHRRLEAFQCEYKNVGWASVRLIQNWDLMLVEKALAIYLWYGDAPALGYKLAADYCQHYDARYGTNLNGPSRAKLQEIIRFLFSIEALEDE